MPCRHRVVLRSVLALVAAVAAAPATGAWAGTWTGAWTGVGIAAMQQGAAAQALADSVSAGPLPALVPGLGATLWTAVLDIAHGKRPVMPAPQGLIWIGVLASMAMRR